MPETVILIKVHDWEIIASVQNCCHIAKEKYYQIALEILMFISIFLGCSQPWSGKHFFFLALDISQWRNSNCSKCYKYQTYYSTINKISSFTLPLLPLRLKKHYEEVEEEKRMSERDGMREKCKMLPPDIVQLPRSSSYSNCGYLCRTYTRPR